MSDIDSTLNNTINHRDKLIEDVKVLSRDVQELLKATASVAGERAADLRIKVQDKLAVVQDKLSDAREQARAKGQAAVAVTDEYVRDNPWNAVGIAAGVGFLIGLGLAASTLLGRRDD